MFHFTLSCGTSEAEATNYYLDCTRHHISLMSGEAGARYARDCTTGTRLLICTQALSLNRHQAYNRAPTEQRALLQDLSLLPRPHTRPSRRLKSVCDDRNHVAWDDRRVDGGESSYVLIWLQAYPALAIVPVDLSTP